jgi:hypothetical protein
MCDQDATKLLELVGNDMYSYFFIVVLLDDFKSWGYHIVLIM